MTNAYRKILVGYDGSENAKRALRKAVELASHQGGTELTVAVAADTTAYAMYSMGQFYASFRDDIVQHARDLAAEASEVARAADVKASSLVAEGRPADMILAKAAATRADLIVMGRRGLGRVKRFLMGSASSAVVNHSTCDVLVVK